MFLRIDYDMYNNEDISKLFLVFKLAKFMLGKYIVLRTCPPGPLKLSILPDTQLEHCQVEYLKKYSTFIK